MPFVAIDHTIAFAIDAAAKASDMQQTDQNIDYLKALFHIVSGHKHGGGTDDGAPVAGVAANAIDQTALAPSAVGQGELKTAAGSVSTTSSSYVNLTLPGGGYGFYPQLKGTDGVYANINTMYAVGTYTTLIALHTASIDGTGAFALQRYVQASPPYMLGSKKWGHFLYLLRRISDGVVVSSYEAEDPCWAYNGKTHLPKDHADRISAVPHPFADYWVKDPAIDGLEVVLVDLTVTNTKKWISDNRKIGKGILEDVGAVMVGRGKKRLHAVYGIPTIPNFTNKVKIVTP